jgi:hypothetical protein
MLIKNGWFTYSTSICFPLICSAYNYFFSQSKIVFVNNLHIKANSLLIVATIQKVLLYLPVFVSCLV